MFNIFQEGYWELDSELGQQLGVDVTQCERILKEAGLYSLGN